MKKKGPVSNVVILAILILAVLAPVVAIFFLDGGEIKGFETPNKSSELKLHQPVTIDGLTVEIIDEEIEPIYDDMEITQLEFWQLSQREMIMQIITYPMAHIPLSTGKHLSYIYFLLGCTFFIGYYNRISKMYRDFASLREQVYRYICDNPGRSQQQITDAIQMPRSSLRYHLYRLRKNNEIHQKNYGEYPRYFSSRKELTNEKKVLHSLISEEKDHLLFQILLDNPGITRKKLAVIFGTTEATVTSYLTRFKKHSLFTIEKDGKEVQYTLTPKTVRTYRELVPDTSSPAA